MKTRLALGAFAALALTMSGVMAGEALKSGVPVGKKVNAFNPLNVTGKFKGTKRCLV